MGADQNLGRFPFGGWGKNPAGLWAPKGAIFEKGALFGVPFFQTPFGFLGRGLVFSPGPPVLGVLPFLGGFPFFWVAPPPGKTANRVSLLPRVFPFPPGRKGSPGEFLGPRGRPDPPQRGGNWPRGAPAARPPLFPPPRGPPFFPPGPGFLNRAFWFFGAKKG